MQISKLKLKGKAPFIHGLYAGKLPTAGEHVLCRVNSVG
jgi:hypothetical protein